MVEGAGNIIGGGWRCCVQADIVSQNATQAVIGVHIIYRRTDRRAGWRPMPCPVALGSMA